MPHNILYTLKESFPYLLLPFERIAEKWVGRPYGELVECLMKDGLGVQVQLDEDVRTRTDSVLPLGLYRRSSDANSTRNIHTAEALHTSSDPHQSLQFVFTNPPSDTVIQGGDMLYVIASSEWGHRVVLAGDKLEFEGSTSASIFEES